MNNSSVHSKLLSRMFFRLLPYQVLMLVINAANCIVDSIFASNFIGKTAMTSIGFYAPMDHFLFALSIMLVSGSQLLIGRALGRNDLEEVRTCFSSDLAAAFCVSVVTSLAMVLAAATNAFGVIVKKPEELASFNSYLLGQAPGIPALVLGQQFFAFLSLENKTKRTMAAGICCVAVNTVMDVLFVYAANLGTFGLGLGSAVAVWAFCLVNASYYFTGKSEMKFSLRSFRMKKCLDIVQMGYPGAISRFVEMFRCFIVNLLILRYVGSGGLSAFAASNSVMAIFWPVPFGMMAVTRMMLGISIGEEDRSSLVGTCRVFMRNCMVFQLCLTALLVLLARPFTLLFFRDPADEVYQMTLMGLRILPLCMPLAVISLNFACYAQAMEKKFLSVALPVLDGMVGVVCCSLVLIPAMKMTGLYIANVINGVLCFLLIFFHAWAAGKKIPRSAEDLLVVPDSFGAAPEDRMDLEIQSMPEVMEISARVMDFCAERGVDSRRASHASLALEEMAGNIVSHGFAADHKKHHYIMIRVIRKGDDLILRLRDNCAAFDPLERARMIRQEDPVSNIGLRIVLGISRDVCYQNLLGTNVLTLRL